MSLTGFVCFFVVFICVNGQRVTIPNGVIQGRQEYSQRGISFYSFQQIPFAKPPIGPLRFKEPVPAEPWSGVLDATKNDKMCFQQTDHQRNVPPDKNPLENEDCLYLNVYTPVEPSTNVSLPVMFYIYGGGFANGTGNFEYYGPHYLMEHGVIVVTINYRVAVFGFLSTGDTVIPGNYGLKDQLLGLKWVQENIKYFGGDPSKVTIFGQSAGGASVTYHMLSQKSKGLFRAGISQSASFLCPWGFQRHNRDIAYQLAGYLNSSFDPQSSSKDLLKFLQSVSAKDLINAASADFPQAMYDNSAVQGYLFTPVIEPKHENAFITDAVYDALEKGLLQKVPLIIGILSEEMIIFASEAFVNLTTRAYDNDVTLLVNDNMHLVDKNQKKIAGRAIKKIYTDGSFKHHPGKLVQYYSDTSFGRPIIQHARLQSKFSDVYFYHFSYAGTLPGTHFTLPDAGKVGHCDDNYYLWVTANNSNLNTMPQSDILTSERFRILFTNFAKDLNPVSEKTDVLGIKNWPKLKPDNFQYLDINTTLTIKKDLKKTTHDKWVDIYEEYAIKPFDSF